MGLIQVDVVVRLENHKGEVKMSDEQIQGYCAAETEMPRYKCHKEVWALKIKSIAYDSAKAEIENRETDGSAIITPEEEGYAPFKVSHDYVRKHNPQAGGYYVVYKDGYKSFSPAEAFENGYTRVN